MQLSEALSRVKIPHQVNGVYEGMSIVERDKAAVYFSQTKKVHRC